MLPTFNTHLDRKRKREEKDVANNDEDEEEDFPLSKDERSNERVRYIDDEDMFQSYEDSDEDSLQVFDDDDSPVPKKRRIDNTLWDPNNKHPLKIVTQLLPHQQTVVEEWAPKITKGNNSFTKGNLVRSFTNAGYMRQDQLVVSSAMRWVWVKLCKILPLRRI